MSNASTIAKFAALLTGAAVSLLAGYVSVTGLHALFPVGGVVVLAMGAAMEVGKVVAVACWRHTAGPLRAGLAALILLLTSITAIGVYGFLSSAHLTDQVPGIAAAAQADRYAAELSIATNLLGPVPSDVAADVADLAAWTVVANVILNLDETFMCP